MKRLTLLVVCYVNTAARAARLGARSVSFARPAISGHKARAHAVRAAVLVGGVALALAGARTWGQQYQIDGGFEAVTVDPALNANGDTNLWTKDYSSAGAYRINSTGIPRTGSNCMRFTFSGNGGHRLQTRQIKFNSVAKW